MRVNSHIFGGDPCPGTRKYVEVHYACAGAAGAAEVGASVEERVPPWLYENGALELWEEQVEVEDDADDVVGVRRPILVDPTTPPQVRIPITTPRAATSTTVATTTTTSTTATTTMTTTTTVEVVKQMQRGKGLMSYNYLHAFFFFLTWRHS